MAYEVWWALVLGFAISAIVQAWVPRQRIERALAGRGWDPWPGPPALAPHRPRAPTRRSPSLGRSLPKGASAASALAFQFASTNLVWELGLVLWVLLGWQFTAGRVRRRPGDDRADGGDAPALRLSAARGPRPGHAQKLERPRAEKRRGVDGLAPAPGSPRPGARSATSSVRDWRMLWKEITIGFLLAGFIGLLGDDFFNALFIEDAPTWSRRSRTSSSGHWSPS